MNQQAEAVSIDSMKKVRLAGNPEHWLALVVTALVSIGTVMVFSATVAKGGQDVNFAHLIRHSMHLGAGAIVLWAVASIRIDWLERVNKGYLLLGIFVFLALVFTGLGVEVNGSSRWVELGGIRLQPSEFAKIAAVIYFADYLARKKDSLHLFRVGVANIGWVAGAFGLLLLLQPDFGATVVILATIAVMMLLGGVRISHLALSILIVTGLMTLILWMEPYRVIRMLSYRDPWADPYGSGFQLVQSLIAIGRGEWFGAGLGSSIQKLSYLPHAGNDFLIAIIGEELGAIGIFCVLSLFAALLFLALVIGQQALERGFWFSGLLAQGTGVILVFQAAVHTGVNTGLLPTKGLTLPLMSYGGSSLLSSMAAVGLLFAISRHTRLRSGAGR